MINDPEVFLSIKDENKKRIQIYIYKKTAITMYWMRTDSIGNLPLPCQSTMYKRTVTRVWWEIFCEAPIGSLWPYSKARCAQSFIDKIQWQNVVVINQLNQLAEDLIKNPSLKPSIFYYTHSKAIIHYKWLFLSSFCFWGGEWFMRRYFGSY